MKQVVALAQTVFKATIRDRLLAALVVAGLLLLLGARVLGTISLGEDLKIITDIGLAGIFIFNLLIVLFVGTNLIAQEIERKSIYLVLAKPVSRAQVVLGKFIGLALIILFTTAVMGGMLIAILHSNTLLILESLIFSYIELLVLVALTLLFAGFAATLGAAIYVLALYVIGHSMSLLWQFSHGKDIALWMQRALEAVYYVLPNLEKFSIQNQVAYGVGVSAEQWLTVLGYGALYSAIGLTLAIAVFNKREF